MKAPTVLNEVPLQASHLSSESRLPRSTINTTARPSLLPNGSAIPFALVVLLFFIWGMSNNLTDILVQQFRKGFSLSQLQAQTVQSAVFFGYFSMALPAALLMRRRRYKAGILLGLCTFGIGTLLFWPGGHWSVRSSFAGFVRRWLRLGHARNRGQSPCTQMGAPKPRNVG